jgi:DNA-binding response OmpR family regulator
MPAAKSILIVDDDRDLVEAIRTALAREGFATLVGQNGFDAQKLIAEQKPDLVILDLAMPRMGGYPVLEHFHGQPDAPPFIALNSSEGSRHKAYAEFYGVVDYLRKPFVLERLLDAVRARLPDANAT